MYDPDEERVLYDASEDDGSSRRFYWSALLQQSFREELEKYVFTISLSITTHAYAYVVIIDL